MALSGITALAPLLRKCVGRMAVAATSGLFSLPDQSAWASVAAAVTASLFTAALGIVVTLGLPVWVAMGWALLFRDTAASGQPRKVTFLSN